LKSVKRIVKILLILTFVFSLSTSWLDNTEVYAEGPNDPAPEIPANGTANGKKILFDNTHGQTAGAADWVIDGAFSDFANALADQGYYIKELRKTTPITYDDLSSYDVFVIPEANIPFKASEQDAILQYVQNGGSVFFIADHYNADRNKNRWDASEVFNGYRRGAWTDPTKGMDSGEVNSDEMQNVESRDWLAEHFGVRFRYNAIGDVVANDIVAPEQAFGITEGVDTVAMHAGSTLAIIDPNKAKGIVYLPETNTAWPYTVDQGVYNGGGRAEGAYVAVAKLSAGKAAFIGDSSPVEDSTPKYYREDNGLTKTTYDGFKEQDDATLLIHIVDWLSKQEDYTALNEVNGLQLDQTTALYAFEESSASTEPEDEPWAEPDEGYLWYDSTTFKAGSYGGPDAPSATGTRVFFSEYIEGSGNNKAIEIFNETCHTIDLSDYRVELYPNGNRSITSALQLSGKLASGDVYVIAHHQADNTILKKADTTASVAYFNGDDTLVLKHNGTIIDVFGQVGVDPGSSWGSGTTVNHTLVRKSKVLAGDANPDDEFVPTTEWQVYAQDTFTKLGTHTMDGFGLTIEEVRNQGTGKTVCVEGVITTTPGSWGAEGFYIQDDTAGVYIYQDDYTGLEAGDVVKLQGKTAIYQDEFEVTDLTSLVKIGTDNLPAAREVTPEQVDDSNQGQIVALNEVTITNLHEVNSYGTFEFVAVKGSESVTVHVDNRTGLTYSNFAYENGDVVHITGVSSIHNGTYQVKPRWVNDIVLVENGTPEPDEPTSGTGVFFSEYIEGSNNNKAIEIFNGTRHTIDLSDYRVELYANGRTSVTSAFQLSGKLTSGDVYVIAHHQADRTILKNADTTASVAYFNGDDALVLKHNGTIIDVFGQVGVDPGSSWGANGETINHTLVRKSTVITGDPNPYDTFNPTAEWNVFAQDTFDYLGTHTMDAVEAPEGDYIWANKSMAKVGETVNIIGKISSTSGTIKVVDANGNLLLYDSLKLNKHGRFAYHFKVPDIVALDDSKNDVIQVMIEYGNYKLTESVTIVESKKPKHPEHPKPPKHPNRP